MSAGQEENLVIERAGETLKGRIPVSLVDDIGCAARSDVPVLITGRPEDCREIACAIYRHGRTSNGSVEVIDCRHLGALGKVMNHESWHFLANGTTHRSILLLQEVHALNLSEQAEFERRLVELRLSRRNTGLRIMASCSTSLFDRVLDGSFDERLYYRLNVIHMVVG